MADLGAFIAQWDGRRADFPGGDGGQCVDLVEFWARANGFPRFFGNAIDQAGHSWPGATWIANTPTNAPSPGDCVVWGRAVGTFGHIDICISGDANSFTGFDQNWPIGSPCHRQNHNYNGVLGWQALHVAPAPPPIYAPPPAPPPPPPPPSPPFIPPPLALSSSVAPALLLVGAAALAGWTYWQHRRSGVPVTLSALREDVIGDLRGVEHLAGLGLGDLEGVALSGVQAFRSIVGR